MEVNFSTLIRLWCFSRSFTVYSCGRFSCRADFRPKAFVKACWVANASLLDRQFHYWFHQIRNSSHLWLHYFVLGRLPLQNCVLHFAASSLKHHSVRLCDFLCFLERQFSISVYGFGCLFCQWTYGYAKHERPYGQQWGQSQQGRHITVAAQVTSQHHFFWRDFHWVSGSKNVLIKGVLVYKPYADFLRLMGLWLVRRHHHDGVC